MADQLATRQLQPCGTPAAYIRHKRRGEPIDEACETAYRRHNTQRAQDARAQLPVGACAACQRERPIRRHGWCESCLTRWYNAGRPDDGPPRLDTQAPYKASARTRRARGEALREDFAWLLAAGTSVEEAAARVGIAETTARQWQQQWATPGGLQLREVPTPRPPRALQPCGTLGAVARHRRRKEPLDEACRKAHAAAARQYRHTGRYHLPASEVSA